MEDILDVYKLPLDPKKPVICFDEMTKQLLKNIREPIPVKPGKPLKVDFHYEKKGIVNIFMFAEPLAGKRHVELFENKTGFDFAEALRMIVEDFYPKNCNKISLDYLIDEESILTFCRNNDENSLVGILQNYDGGIFELQISEKEWNGLFYNCNFDGDIFVLNNGEEMDFEFNEI